MYVQILCQWKEAKSGTHLVPNICIRNTVYNLSFCLFWVDFMFPNIINFIIIFRQIGQMHPILFLVTKCSRFLSDYDIFGIKCLQFLGFCITLTVLLMVGVLPVLTILRDSSLFNNTWKSPAFTDLASLHQIKGSILPRGGVQGPPVWEQLQP